MPPENSFSIIFRGYKLGVFARNGLIEKLLNINIGKATLFSILES